MADGEGEIRCSTCGRCYWLVPSGRGMSVTRETTQVGRDITILAPPPHECPDNLFRYTRSPRAS